MKPSERYLKFALFIWETKFRLWVSLRLSHRHEDIMTLPSYSPGALCSTGQSYLCLCFIFILEHFKAGSPSSVSNRCKDSLSVFLILVSSCESVCALYTRSQPHSNTHRQSETTSCFSSLPWSRCKGQSLRTASGLLPPTHCPSSEFCAFFTVYQEKGLPRALF